MSVKDLFWKSGDNESDEGSEQPVTEETSTSLPPRQSGRTSSVLNDLRQGPSATIFERTIGRSATSGSKNVDAEFNSVIQDALNQDSKEPGYKEFMAQYNALRSIITDSSQCTAAALAAVSASNPKLNATQVAKAIGERMKLLGEYDSAYAGESDRNEEAEGHEKSSAIAQMQSRIKEFDDEMARISSEREQLASQAEKLGSELSGVKSKYDGYRQRFSNTADALRAELKTTLNFVAPGAGKKGE